MNYEKINQSLFSGKLSASQKEGIDQLLKAGSLLSLAAMAYVLATAYHETAKTMQPIEEYGKGKNRTYGHKVKYSGKPYFEPDKIYYGRGHTQNTWYEIYEKLTNANGKGWDFLNHPELLLQMEPSVWATIYAMTTGLYTGRKLSQYFNASGNDPVGARKIINGQDKAELIAGYYNHWLEAV